MSTNSDTLTGQAAQLSRGDLSSTELTRSYLDRIAATNAELNAFITVCEDTAITAATASDKRRAEGNALGPLDGIPIAHKDIFCTEGIRTSAGSRMLDSFIAPYSATVVENLASAGAVLLGKTSMDEFAMGSSNESSFYGPVANPWNTQHVPGGSSGGSAAAVAARLCAAATGTDTGGSIRQPAALCGITGLKPTYGRVSRWGMIAFASSLDQAGPMARSAEDCAVMLQAMAGHDARDATSLSDPVPDFAALLGMDLTGLRIGLCTEFFQEGLDAAAEELVRAAIRELEAAGAVMVDITLPNARFSVPAYYVIAPAEASANLSRYDGVRFGHRCTDPVDLADLYRRSRSEGFGDEVKQRILVGTFALSAGFYDAYYARAQKIRRLIKNDFVKAFAECDVLLSPTTPGTAFRHGEKSSDPVAMYLEDVYTVAASLAGLPAMSVPVGHHKGLPVGMQLIGNYLDEPRLLGVAHQYQMRTGFHSLAPGDVK